jgi:transposase
VRETVLEREEVRANPAAFREIDRVVTERLDYRPAAIFVQRVVRVVHVPLDDPDGVPLKVPAPPSIGLSATPRLVFHVLCSKYAHHRPHYRTQGILRQRHGVELARNTLCNWDRVAADTCEPVYKLIHSGLLERHLLQADETPVHYLDPGAGNCGNGFFWVLHAPRDGDKGDILFQWHPNRRAACLDSLLGDWRGLLQTDAYAAYDSWAADKPGVTLAACWAHARRKFHEAFQAGQTLAAGPLAAIQRLYQVEATLRRCRAGPEQMAEARQQSAAPLLNILKSDLVALRQRPEVLPKSPLGAAIDYTLGLWDRLTLYARDGRLPIDNNWIENGIRPTAVGKRNWLFVGSETTGQRAAILFTLVECARRHGHDPELYLTDLLERLPAMTNRDDLGALLPARWRPEAAVAALHS